MTVALAVVEEVEVGHDDRHRERDGKHAGDSTERPDQLTPRPDRAHVAVADGRHRYDGPPERVRDTGEVRQTLGLQVRLGEVDGTGEQHDADDEEEDEEAELPETGADRQAEDLKSLGVARQLEDTEDSDEPDDAENGERARL